MDKKAIRQEIRARRRALSTEEQKQAGESLAKQILALPELQTDITQRVAIYLSVDGELDTTPTIRALWEKQHDVYVPVLHPFRKGYLIFVAYTPDTTLIKNRLGILEPPLACPSVSPLKQLDVLFTPLVAFDNFGNRLGMGGGFYDRTLSTYARDKLKKPHLIGLAHDCQQVTQLPIEPWDIKINKIATPSNIHQWCFS